MPGAAQVEEFHHGRTGHLSDDDGVDIDFVTSFDLRSTCLTAKHLLKDLEIAHSCTLSLALLTPFTLSPSIQLLCGCRMIQSLLMGQYVLLHPNNGKSKLRCLLRGTFCRGLFLCVSWDDPPPSSFLFSR